MSEKENKLYIPQGLKLRVEIFEGFGKEELGRAIIAIIFGGLLDVIFYLWTKSITKSMIFIITVVAGSIICLTKDNTNTSVVDQAKFWIRFLKSQKKYKYERLKEWDY